MSKRDELRQDLMMRKWLKRNRKRSVFPYVIALAIILALLWIIKTLVTNTHIIVFLSN